MELHDRTRIESGFIYARPLSVDPDIQSEYLDSDPVFYTTGFSTIDGKVAQQDGGSLYVTAYLTSPDLDLAGRQLHFRLLDPPDNSTYNTSRKQGDNWKNPGSLSSESSLIIELAPDGDFKNL